MAPDGLVLDVMIHDARWFGCGGYDSFGDQAPGDEGTECRDFGFGSESEGAFLIVDDERFEGVPVHEGEVLVGGVFVVGGESFEEGPAVFWLDFLGGGGEVETEEGEGFCSGHGQELFRLNLLIFKKELDGPGSNVLIGIVKQRWIDGAACDVEC